MFESGAHRAPCVRVRSRAEQRRVAAAIATRPFPLAGDKTVAARATRRFLMPLLIDPPSVSRRLKPRSGLVPLLPSSVPPALRFHPLAPALRRARGTSFAAARYRNEDSRGRTTRERLRARDADRVRPPLPVRRPALARPFLPHPLLSAGRPSVSCWRAYGVWSSRGGYAARHPRKSTTGGRSRTVAPEPQQPATHDPTDPLHPCLGLSPRHPVFHPCSAAVLHPPRCVELSPSPSPTTPPPILLLPPSVCSALLSQLRVP